jgi:hypothetical protein
LSIPYKYKVEPARRVVDEFPSNVIEVIAADVAGEYLPLPNI